MKEVPIKATNNSAMLKRYSGRALLVAFDGGYGEGVGTIGVQIAETDPEKNLLVLGEFDVGTTNNEAECLACLKAF